MTKKLHVFHDVCSAVAFAHDHGILHRDIKPANIVMTSSEEPVLTDFDIADLLFVRTLSALPSGTVSYAAPEQLSGLPRRDPTGDVFSLGRLLHYFVIERDPDFIFESIPMLHDLSESPEGLVRIIRKCTMRSPEDRYATVDELLYDMKRYESHPQEVGVGIATPIVGDVVSELYEMMYRSGIASYFASWQTYPTPQRIMRASTIDQVLDGRIKIQHEDDGHVVTGGGPPFRLSHGAYQELSRTFNQLRQRLLDRVSSRGNAAMETVMKAEKVPVDSRPLAAKFDSSWPAGSLTQGSPGPEASYTSAGSGNPVSPQSFLREAIKAVPAVTGAFRGFTKR